MAACPRVVAFDIVETTFSLESLRPLLSAQGIPGASLETWFARLLRDAFALAATDRGGDPCRGRARAWARPGEGWHRRGAGRVRAARPHPDAAEAFRILRSADVRVAALSNGAELVQIPPYHYGAVFSRNEP